MSDERLAEIGRRNDYLRNIPFNTHGPGIHGDNCPPCGMVRGIGDVTALLELIGAGREEWAVHWRTAGGRDHYEACESEEDAREAIPDDDENYAVAKRFVGDWKVVAE
jgi:hypothetical protein